VERVRVRKRVLVGDLPIQGEVPNGLDADLSRCACTGTSAVAADVDENAGEPGRPGRGKLQAVKGAVRLEQGILDRVLGLVADEPPSDRIQTWKLLFSEQTELLLGTALLI
jgi:hypothetical protein